jgi:hypothetical protein
MPVLLREEDALPSGPFRWRLIAQTDDEALAEGVMALMARRCYSESPDAIRDPRGRSVTPLKPSQTGPAQPRGGATLPGHDLRLPQL